ncbi:MAG: TIGR00725 family protein [Pseudomonadota bacterium]|nr:TIGR00725 family protein [Pseudomonadota bacterium]
MLAHSVGSGLIDAGYRLVTGGMGGVMEAAHRGARDSKNWFEGAGIGILPGTNAGQANQYVDIAIPTGIDHGRNLVVAQSEAVIAVGGGAGTLSEIALAWIHRRLIIAMRCDGWSERLADQKVDRRVRYKDIPEDRVFGADSAEEAIALLTYWLPQYATRHRPIV